MLGLQRVLRSRARRGVLVGVACALICWLLDGTSWVRDLEHHAYDNCLGFRGRRTSQAKIIIVRLDNPSLEKLGKPLVFLSPELADVVKYLHDAGAASIGLDVLVPDQENKETMEFLGHGGPGEAEAMGRAVVQAGNVELPDIMREGETPLLPMYEWRLLDPDWADLGCVDLSEDADQCVRRQDLTAQDPSRQLYPSFAVAVFTKAGRMAPPESADDPLLLDGRPIPLDHRGAMRINYVGPPGTIPHVPFYDVLEAARGKRSLPQDWRGAMVLIGRTAPRVEDTHHVPRMNLSIAEILQSTWSRHATNEVPGVEIHANIIATLADRRFLVRPWWLNTPILLILAGAILGTAFSRLSLEAGAALLAAYLVAWQAFCLLAFRYADWPVEQVAMFTLGILLYGVIFGLRWRVIRRMMGMIKSEAVAQALEAEPGRLKLKGQQREITVLFTDVRNFTDFSESHTASQVVALLNEFFSTVVPLIEAEGGIVNQYLGDGMMVLFGAPRSQPDHALRAVRAAQGIIARVHQLQHRWAQLGAEAFRVGIGVHTGKAVVGTIGSPRRLDYTAIGDTVNTASRIESGNKQLQSEILVSEATVAALPEAERRRLALTWQESTLAVKGKREPLKVFAIGAT
ncbi:MAG: adenylate/guanylate cyclase domain-containing protein [Thermoguttaceae bacterium]